MPGSSVVRPPLSVERLAAKRGGLGVLAASIAVLLFGNHQDDSYDGFLILLGGTAGVAIGSAMVALRLLDGEKAVIAGFVGYLVICAPILVLTSGESNVGEKILTIATGIVPAGIGIGLGHGLAEIIRSISGTNRGAGSAA